MSSSNSAPDPAPSPTESSTHPDFVGLVRFLVEPFLDSPTSLSIDCERLSGGSRVWIRIAFKGEDRGRVFGRGGRNIQAIRTVIRATAKLSGLTAHLDVYGESSSDSASEKGGGHRPPRQRPRNAAKLRKSS
ncbi:MAG: KH domain-containing protein [Leptolyngbyaceae cyanobacterium MO_188.B28]|nr:KH domain-containing protein [Leptolyngbyaceae cyanobacterium MO_188.B28]